MFEKFREEDIASPLVNHKSLEFTYHKYLVIVCVVITKYRPAVAHSVGSGFRALLAICVSYRVAFFSMHGFHSFSPTACSFTKLADNGVLTFQRLIGDFILTAIRALLMKDTSSLVCLSRLIRRSSTKILDPFVTLVVRRAIAIHCHQG